MHHLGQVGHRGGFGDFKTQRAWGQVQVLKGGVQRLPEALVGQRGARQVDAVHPIQLPLLAQPVTHPGQGVVDHPLVDAGHQAIPFGSGQERTGQDGFAILLQTNQDFVVPLFGGAGVQRHDGHHIKPQAVLVQRGLQAVDPLHLPLLLQQGAVRGLVHVHPVATVLFGRVAGGVSP